MQGRVKNRCQLEAVIFLSLGRVPHLRDRLAGCAPAPLCWAHPSSRARTDPFSEGPARCFATSYMCSFMDSIDSLPLFPLGLVLYPGEQVPLHIFEDRYKDLTAYCREHDVPFGIVRAHEGEWADVGTTARIDQVVKRYDDGRMDILVHGEERFRLGEVHTEASYYTADVTLMEDEASTVDLDLKERVITQHMKLLELAGRTVRPDLYEDVEQLSFVLAQNGALEGDQKQEVLECRTEKERIRYLIQHFETIIPRIEKQEGVQRRIRSNGHFKDFPPEEV